MTSEVREAVCVCFSYFQQAARANSSSPAAAEDLERCSGGLPMSLNSPKQLLEPLVDAAEASSSAGGASSAHWQACRQQQDLVCPCGNLPWGAAQGLMLLGGTAQRPAGSRLATALRLPPNTLQERMQAPALPRRPARPPPPPRRRPAMGATPWPSCAPASGAPCSPLRTGSALKIRSRPGASAPSAAARRRSWCRPGVRGGDCFLRCVECHAGPCMRLKTTPASDPRRCSESRQLRQQAKP